MPLNWSRCCDVTAATLFRLTAVAMLAAVGCGDAVDSEPVPAEPAVAPAAQSGVEPVISAGYAALITHSGVFIAGRGLEDIQRDELGNDPRAAAAGKTVIDRDHKAVTVEYEGMDVPRLAVMLDGLGTILMPIGATLDDRAMLPEVDVPMPEGNPAEIDWPDGDRLSEKPLPTEIDAELLEAAVEAAFSDDKYAPHKTLGVVVVYDDQIVAERYAPSWDMYTQYRSWSSAKSVTSALVGILVGEGKLDVAAPPPIPEWQTAGHPNADITLEHLLHMESGLTTEGRGGSYLYFGGIDTGKEVAASVPDVPPGTRWEYSNYDTLLIVRAIKTAIGDDKAFLTFPRRALLNKIGMRHTFPEIDPYGNFILSSQMWTTARDLARFGLLYLHDGVWNGERILPEGWVDYTAEKAPMRIQQNYRDRGYGAQFWLLGDDPRVPAGTYTTSGARGQLSTIVPSHNLVVTRTGLDPAGSNWDQAELVADVVKAIAPR
ncbi:MAG: serine hydrolase [Vicinamibacterales bacterium]|jgi:CubicO group peptidase (beta-lactamase class C family)|nr:serine hydrolase [Vicinamibacterales bacterium]MDP7690211.1 serine hydrolase [Vicinamibacterales bacterium]HJN43384.1 serine hydrolase [Vicinamibacterales bacterium]